MRISTTMIFDQGVAAIQGKQSTLLTVQQQLASGRRVLTPADDPIASAQALQLTQADDLNTQYRRNRDDAAGKLQLAEATLAQLLDLVAGVRERAVSAGNAAYSAADRASLAGEIEAMGEQMLGVANTTDAEGRYLFSGYEGGTLPFVQNAGAVQFAGDSGARMAQIGPSRQIATNVSGAAALERIPTGNGVFTWSAAAANTGAGLIGPGSVANAALLTGHGYRITFSVAAGATTYAVVDTTTATTVLAAQPYGAAGASIAFDGLSVELKGSPANGDAFDIAPSGQQDVFQTVQDLVAALRAGGGPTALTNKLGNALANLDQAREAGLRERVAVGARLREIDTLNAAGEETGLAYKDARSRLEDVDYAKAISDLMREQTNLEAAQQSFARLTKSNLFDYL